MLRWLRYGFDGHVAQVARPRGCWRPSRLPRDPSLADALRTEISQLISSGAVVPTDRDSLTAVSPVFIVRKSTPGTYRFIVDLRAINAFYDPPRLKLPSWSTVAAAARSGSFFSVLDVRSAFHNVPVTEQLSRLFGFGVEGQFYRFRCLPFGWSVSPWAWARVFRPVLALTRSRNPTASIIVYVDDILVIAPTLSGCRRARDDTASVLLDLGFLLKTDDRFEPSQQTRFLGFSLDSVAGTIGVLPHKRASVGRDVEALARSQVANLIFAARVLGSLRALRPAHRWILLDTAYLARWVSTTRSNRVTPNKRQEALSLPDEVRRECQLVARDLRMLPLMAQLRPAPATLTMTTDASLRGWGGFLSTGERANGLFSPAEMGLPAVAREALAVLFTLRALNVAARRQRILVRSDSTVVVVSLLARRARGVTLIPVIRAIKDEIGDQLASATHIPGIRNGVADELSRVLPEPHAHVISRCTFEHVCAMLCETRPEVDLFADRLTRKVPLFFAARPDPAALGVNSFSADWGAWRLAYANPPFSLLSRVLMHVHACSTVVSVLLIVPAWETADWSATCNAMTIAELTMPASTPGLLHSGRTPRWPLRAVVISNRPLQHANSDH